jgi:DNA-binding transcriptional LysR family regulator
MAEVLIMIEDLHIFTVIVEQSSLNKAAGVLNLSQSALSRKVTRLEEDLGVQLFHRLGKRLELTRVGRLTYEYACTVTARHAEFLSMIAEYRLGTQQQLIIGASLTTLQSIFPHILARLTELNAALDIRAITGKTHEIIALVRAKKADIGIISASLADPDITSVPLLEDHLVLVTPRKMNVNAQLEQLNTIPMVLFSEGSWSRDLTDAVFKKHQLHPDIKMEIDSFEAILRLLPTYQAAALLPASYLRPEVLMENGLTYVTIDELTEDTRRTISLIHPNNESLHPTVAYWLLHRQAVPV